MGPNRSNVRHSSRLRGQAVGSSSGAVGRQPRRSPRGSEGSNSLKSVSGKSAWSEVKSGQGLVVLPSASCAWQELGNCTKDLRASSAARILAFFLVGPVPSKVSPFTSTATAKTGACTGPVCDTVRYCSPGRSSCSCTKAFLGATDHDSRCQRTCSWHTWAPLPSSKGRFLFNAGPPPHASPAGLPASRLFTFLFSFTSVLLVPVGRRDSQDGNGGLPIAHWWLAVLPSWREARPWLSVCIGKCIWVRTCASTDIAYIHVHSHMHTYMHICTVTHLPTHANPYTFTCPHMHTYTYPHRHAYTLLCTPYMHSPMHTPQTGMHLCALTCTSTHRALFLTQVTPRDVPFLLFHRGSGTYSDSVQGRDYGPVLIWGSS